ncbi:hypothetical protein VTI28DRAFT_3124 [Corynascus sepedonium]
MSSRIADGPVDAFLRGIGIWVETTPGILVGPVLIIIIEPTSPWAALDAENLNEVLLEYCPPWSPVRAHYRLGYGWDDNWYWLDTPEDVPVNGLGMVTLGNLA